MAGISRDLSFLTNINKPTYAPLIRVPSYDFLILILGISILFPIFFVLAILKYIKLILFLFLGYITVAVVTIFKIRRELQARPRNMIIIEYIRRKNKPAIWLN